MVDPQYQELLKTEVPHVRQDGVHVAVIAGSSYGASVSHACGIDCIVLMTSSLGMA